MNIISVVILAVLLNISGAIVAKYVAVNTAVLYIAIPLVGLLAAIYLARTVFWILVGRKYQLSYIYPVLSINYVFSFLLGMYLFNEHFELSRCIGAFIIVAGVLIVSLSKHKYERSEP
jgi:multidrug transporter EmrE-like cation transporter